MNNLNFQYPSWFIIFCILAGLVFAFILYYRDEKLLEKSKTWVWVLSVLRFLSVFGISFLLLGPLFKVNQEQIKNPTVVIVQDASSSVDGDIDNSLLVKELREKLATEFEVDGYHFSNVVEDGLVDTLDGLSTNISEVFHFLDETYANQNLGAVIMSTDGIFNEGIQPFYQKNNLSNPFYFIAQGDTTQKKDIGIKQVYHNKIAYLGDKFVIQPDIFANNFKGTTTNVSVYLDGKLLKRKQINITQDNYFETVEMELPADRVGVVKYNVQVEKRAGEFNKSNNNYSIYVDVLDSRQKILLVANSPHPDIQALQQLIKTNKNYEVDIRLANEDLGVVAAYDLVILHNLPSQQYPVSSLLQEVEAKKKPLFIVAGVETDVQRLNAAQNLISIQARTNSSNEVIPILENNFSLFELTDELKSGINKLPPLRSLFGDYKLKSGATNLISQKIGTVATGYPLMAFGELGGSRQAVLMGEGIWKWRLGNFQERKNFDMIEDLIGSTIQYLSVKEDKRKFRVNPTTNVFKEFDRITFEAELYNDSYEKINETDASIKIKNDAGKEFDYTFSKIADFYQLDAGNFPPGNYTYTGTVSNNGNVLSSSGKFSITEIQLESANTTADHRLLSSLVEKHGGNIFYDKTADEIIQEIKDSNPLKPVISYQSKTESVLNLKWILFLLMGLLFAEWFIRRYMGTY